MPRIVTVTFNPCIDKSTSISCLLPEKKLSCSIPKLEPGGGGINVARAIKRLGGEALAIYPAGGYTGKCFRRLLEKENVPSIMVETRNETRENIIVYDESSALQYRFGFPGASLSDEEWQNILQVVEDANDVEYIVASGSLPPGVPSDIFASLAIIAQQKNARFIVDSSGQPLKNALGEGVFLIKPNLVELSFLVDKDRLEGDEIMVAAKQLVTENKCRVVVVSMGKNGALMVSGNSTLEIVPPFVETKSTVGAGDSMVAGIIFSLSEGESIETAVQMGVACGTAATMNTGTELCRPEDVRRLFRMIKGAAT